MNNQLQEDVTVFFRKFALRVLEDAKVNPNDPKAFKLAMLDHYEQIYAHFSQTQVFKDNYNQAKHDEMVAEYKRCFTLLLMGKLP